MATVADENGLVNPPPSNQPVFNKKIRDARGNLVTDKAANGAFLAYVFRRFNNSLKFTFSDIAIASTRSKKKRKPV